MNERLTHAIAITDQIAEYLRSVGLQAENSVAADLLSGGEPQKLFAEVTEAYLPTLRAYLDEAYAALSNTDAMLEPAERALSQKYHRLRVQPFFLGSAFVRWSIDKPLGYPGDFRIVEMLFDNQPNGESPMSYLLSTYTLDCGPTRAHRARLPWAHKHLRALEQRNDGRPLEVLSFACGPERVMRAYVNKNDATRITLADFDPRALALAENKLRQAVTETGASSIVHNIKASAFDLIKNRSSAQTLRSTRTDGLYDAVMVLGLFDYLTDDQCTRMVAALSDVLAPGGICLLTNLHAGNPWRSFMEHVGHWEVTHRAKSAFGNIVLRAGTLDEIELITDESDTNVFFAGRRRG